MESLALGLIGYGELGQVVERWLCETHPAPSLRYFDDIACKADCENAFSYQQFSSSDHQDLQFLVCLGYRQPSAKQAAFALLRQNESRIFSLFHRYAMISISSQIGAGTIVGPGVVIDSGAILGEGVLVHCNATISHDARIGSCSYVSPGAIICGRARIGERTFIGAGAIIRDGVEIGDDCRIGMGAVVDREVPDGVSAVGSPLRLLNHHIEL